MAAQGNPEDALVLEDIPLPKLNRGEVLVKVQAAALNPVSVSISAHHLILENLTRLTVTTN